MAGAILISSFGCANGLILSGARVYYAMAKDGLFFKQCRQTASYVQDAGGFADGADGVGVPAVRLGQLRAASGLHYFRGARVLHFDDRRIVCAAAHASGCRAALSCGGLSRAAGIYIVMALFIDVVLLRYKPQFTWPGLIVVLLGIPVYYAWSRSAGARRVPA
jgi:basic amino acid/polyamine antiporter, APA family